MLTRFFVVGLFVSTNLLAMTVNRINGGGTIMYVDFSIAGPSVPLELSRGYNTITSLSEKSGWKGAFGWGWTSPFETTLTTTPDRQVVLRDGANGNTIYFRQLNQTEGALEEFMAAFKKAYFEQQKNQKLTQGELQSLNLPTTLDSKLRTDPKFRAKMSTRYKIPVNLTSGQKFVSSEYGYQSIEYQNGKWVRNKNGLIQTFDAKGRLVRQTDKNGFYFDFVYPAPDSFQISEIRDANKGMSLKFKWELGRVVQITDNRNTRALYRYDAVGNLVGVNDSSGQTYVYKYENKKYPHLLTRIEYPSESKSGAVYREFRYDSDGLISYLREKDGTEIDLAYGRNSSDPENNFWTKSVRKISGTKTETYEEFELKKRADGGGKYLYRQTTRVNGATNVTIFSECCGQPLQVTQNGVTTQFTYYPDGLVKTRVSPKESASFEYDMRWKKPNKVTQPGLISRYEYDSRGNLVKASNSNKQSVALKYDSMGRVQSLTNEQKRTFTFSYKDSPKPTLISESGVGSIELNYGPDGSLMGARTIASKARKAINSEQMVKKVQQGFQQLLSILRPAGLSDSRIH